MATQLCFETNCQGLELQSELQFYNEKKKVNRRSTWPNIHRTTELSSYHGADQPASISDDQEQVDQAFFFLDGCDPAQGTWTHF